MAESNPPPGSSLRGLNETQLAQWYNTNLPQGTADDAEPDLRTWQEGLMADDSVFDLVSELCDTAAKETGLYKLLKYDYKDNPEKVVGVIDQTARKIVYTVQSEFPNVPKDWHYSWARAWASMSVEGYHQLPTFIDGTRMETVREPTRPQRRELKPEPERESERIRTAPTTGLPLHKTLTSLKLVGDRIGDPGKTYTSKTSNCIFGGLLGEKVGDYHLHLLLDDFQYLLEEGGDRVKLDRDELQYNDGEGRSITIKDQDDFEHALRTFLHYRSEPDADIRLLFFSPKPTSQDQPPAQPPAQRVQNAPFAVNKARQVDVSGAKSIKSGASKPITAPESSGRQAEGRNKHRGATDKAFTEKIPRLRNMFRPGKLPSDEALQDALLGANGDVTRAYALLGGKPRTSTIPVRQASRVPKQTATDRPRRQPTTAAKPEAAPTRTPATTAVSGSRPTERTKKEVASSSAFPPRGASLGHLSRLTAGESAIEKPRKSSDDTVSPIEKPPSIHSATPDTSKRRASFITAPFDKVIKIFGGGKSKEEVEPPQSSVGDSLDTMYPEVKMVLYRAGGVDTGESDDAPEGSIATGRITEVEDEGVEKQKDRVAQFKELLNRDVLMQMTSETVMNDRKVSWEECCRMFEIDSLKNTPNDRVSIAGLKYPLYQFQAFGIFWQMIQSRNVGGGIVADSPGLGKTLSFLGLLVVERQLSILWDRVNKSRQKRDGLHLPARDQLPTAVCPSPPGPGWITCPCVTRAPTARLEPIPGVRMALVPAALIGNWRKQWKQHIDPNEKELDMRLFIVGSNDRLPQAEMADLATNVSLLRATKQKRDNDSALPGQERYLVLATAQSYDSWMDRFKYGGHGTSIETLQSSIRGSRLLWKAGGTKYQIQFGIACADECHEDHHVQSGRARILARLPGNPYCWGYSGTPFDHSPRCLEGILSSIEQQGKRFDPTDPSTRWSHMEHYKQFTHDKFDRLCSNYGGHLKLKENKMQENFEKILEGILTFLTTFVIRRTEDSKWFGHELLVLKPSVHTDVTLAHNDAWDEQIQALEPSFRAEVEMRILTLQKDWKKTPADQRRRRYPEFLGFRNTAYTKYKLRILATCPSLVRFMTGKNALTLRNDETKQWFGKNERSSPYWINIREIYENSPKLIWLRKFLQALDRNKDVDGNEQKVIILTNFYCISLIIKIMIEKYMKKKGRVGLLYAELTGPVKTSIVEAFAEDVTEDKKGKEVPKHRNNFQYIIGTPKQLGTGHQLTRAANVILMEPDVDFGMETQGFSRVKRPGQKNPQSNTYKLVDAGSELETQIQNEHARNQATHGKFIKKWEAHPQIKVSQPSKASSSKAPPYEYTPDEADAYADFVLSITDPRQHVQDNVASSLQPSAPQRAGAIKRGRRSNEVTTDESGQSAGSSPYRSPRRRRGQEHLNQAHSEEEGFQSGESQTRR